MGGPQIWAGHYGEVNILDHTVLDLRPLGRPRRRQSLRLFMDDS
jgi:hypothetical protein